MCVYRKSESKEKKKPLSLVEALSSNDVVDYNHVRQPTTPTPLIAIAWDFIFTHNKRWTLNTFTSFDNAFFLLLNTNFFFLHIFEFLCYYLSSIRAISHGKKQQQKVITKYFETHNDLSMSNTTCGSKRNVISTRTPQTAHWKNQNQQKKNKSNM